MKLSGRWYIYGVLLIGLSAFGVWRYAQEGMGGTVPSSIPKTTLSDNARIDGDPLPDILARVHGPDPRTLSKWLSARSKRYRNLLAGWKCDVLVVPVQVEESAFDRATRYLMSEDLALTLATSGQCVVDPLLVDMALGEGLRTQASQDVIALARELKVGSIVTAYAGHDRAGHMRVTMRVEHLEGIQPNAEPTLIAKKSLENLVYGDDVAPYDAFHQNLPQLLAAVGLAYQTPKAESAGVLGDALPESPAVLAKMDNASLLTQSARYVLLGILAPTRNSRTSERLFAKAWMTLANVPDDDPGAQRMRARILFHLIERPYALKRLEGANGPEADGLRAVLNGDLPTARAALGKIREPWDYAFLSVEVFDLEKTYNRDADATAARAANVFGEAWSGLLLARLADNDIWLVPDLLALKHSLDEVFPIKGQSLEELVKGNLVTGQGDDLADYQLHAARHVHTLLESQPKEWCCATIQRLPTRWDVLDLYDSRVEAAMIQQVKFYSEIQGRSGYALKLMSSYDDVLAGNPDAESVRAYAEWEEYKKGEMSGRAERNERIHAAARISVAVDEGQSSQSANDFWFLMQPPIEPFAHALADAYCEDYPIRPDWPGASPTLKSMLQFSSSNIQPLKNLLGTLGGEARDPLLAELDHRFVGNTDATDLRLDALAARQPLDPAVVRTQITADPDNWNLYSRLSKIYIGLGQYTEASQLAQSFPLFSKKARNTVGLSHDAAEVGFALFFQGALEEAKPLFKIAADYSNGSSSSNRSQARLDLLNSDYTSAAMVFLKNGRRYEDMRDYREYLQLLFAGGESADAWAGFNQLARQYRGIEIWAAAMVGHRRDAISEPELRKWIIEQSASSRRPPGDETIAIYATMEQLIDRPAPPDDFADFMRSLAGASQVRVGPGGKSFFGTLGGEGERRVGPSEFGAARREPVAKDFVVPNRFALFADAYAAYRKGQFDQAALRFDRLAAYYDIETTQGWGFVLPYFAVAAAQSGDKLELEKYVEAKNGTQEQWGIHLAKAVFAGMHGKQEEATKWLDTAFRQRPPTNLWPVNTAYQYAQVCVVLFDATKDEAYRQRALAWAKAYSKIDPAQAWPHALIAKYATDQPERTHELAAALYLDPQSVWANDVPKELQKQALTWQKAHPLIRLSSPDAPAQHL